MTIQALQATSFHSYVKIKDISKHSPAPIALHRHSQNSDIILRLPPYPRELQGPCRTSRNMLNFCLATAFHQTMEGPNIPAPSAQLAHPVWKQQPFTRYGQPLLLTWAQWSLTHQGVPAKVTWTVPMMEAKAQHTRQLLASSGNELSQNCGSWKCPPIWLVGLLEALNG